MYVRVIYICDKNGKIGAYYAGYMNRSIVALHSILRILLTFPKAYRISFFTYLVTVKSTSQFNCQSLEPSICNNKFL